MPDVNPSTDKLYLCHPFVRSSLLTGKFKTIVQLPKYAEESEWIAVNLFDFFTNVNLFMEALSESCTLESCPTMSAGNNFNYPWIEKNGQNTQLPAPTHIDYILTWIQNMLDDQIVFPTRMGADLVPLRSLRRPTTWLRHSFILPLGQDFPSNFILVARNIYRQLLHVFAHIYHAHFTILLHARAEGHFNSLFAHFLSFGGEFELLDAKELHISPGTTIDIALLTEKWHEMGVLV